ncbi:hypothetical protein FRC00_007018 [Tulasnella sp. 408]|nr:hypothetical protein FRC00_007018 [Tulasnella sp. 408]
MGDQKKRLRRMTRSAHAGLRQDKDTLVDESQSPTEVAPDVPLASSNEVTPVTQADTSPKTNPSQVTKRKKGGAARPKATKPAIVPKPMHSSTAPCKPSGASSMVLQLERDDGAGGMKNLVEGVNSILDRFAASSEDDEESDFRDEEELGDDESQEDKVSQSSDSHEESSTQVWSLELAWKLSTAKKSDLPAEFASEKDLKKITSAYRTAVEKEQKKHATYQDKVKKGTVKPGTREPAQVDIVVDISDIGVADKV